MEARSRTSQEYVQYIQYRSVLSAGQALIKTMCIACGNIAFTTTVMYIQKKKLQG